MANERVKPEEKEIDPNRGIPKSNNIPTEDQPSPQMENPSRSTNQQKGQSDFMKPERADQDSNVKSGAV